MLRAGGGGGGVASFNSRTGAVTQTSGDVTTALGFTPLNPANNLNDVNSQATALANLGGVSVLRSYIAGLTLSNDGGTPSSVLDIAAGQAADSGNAVMISIGAFTKSTAGAWTSGTGNNGMGNGLTIANSTWYHVILANNGGTPDIYFDTSATGANRPAGISDTKVRRIGSFLTDGSAHILAFKQVGETFYWSALPRDVAGVTVTATPTLYPLSTPLGVQTRPLLRVIVAAGGAPTIIVSSPSEPQLVPSGNGSPGTSPGFEVWGSESSSMVYGPMIYTDASSNIYLTASASVAPVNVYTRGFVDDRGRYN
jgi:hypothetical protein